MTEETHLSPHDVPSDLRQIPIVWRYELLKYLRSKRLLASLVVVVMMLALMYLLPPTLGYPYSGTATNSSVTVEIPENLTGAAGLGSMDFGSFAILAKSKIDLDTLRLYLDEAPYPSADGANWVVYKITYTGESVYALIFTDDLSGRDVTADYEWYTAPDNFAWIFLNFAPYLIIVCATLFGADSLVGEFYNRTGYLVFPNPIKRVVLYFGKFAASMTASLLIIGLYYIGIAALSPISAGSIDDDLVVSFLFAAEYLMAAMAIAYLISALFKGTTGATVFTFLLFLLILPIVDGVGLLTGIKLEGSLTFAANVMSYILADPYPVDWEFSQMGLSYSMFYPTPSTAAIVMAAYALVAIVLGVLLFKRKQLAG
ncbi:TPA: ABC transporter permease subunit [Thermoplasmata archaeon]|nr:ABC transporter permease subunit [Thermoplasmata archaeon]